MSTSLRRELASLRPGQRAIVAGIAPSCPPEERRRLMELGFFPGTEVEVVLESPLRDPIAYRVRQMTVALRREQARRVQIELPPTEPGADPICASGHADAP